MNKSQIKAIIFDMGGVILRTEDFEPRERLAQKLGIPRDALEVFVFESPTAIAATLGKIPAEEHYDAIAREYHLDAKGRQEFTALFWGGDHVDEQLLEKIHLLRKQYKTAMLSNAWDDTRQFLMTDFPCLEPFDIAIFSAEVKLAKPQPEIYNLALEKLGVKAEEAVFIDDFAKNIEGANALGIHGIQFHSRQQVLADLERVLLEKS